MQPETAVMAEETVHPSVEVEQAATPKSGTQAGSEARKRSASATLEGSPAKAVKTSGGGEISREANAGGVATTGEEGEASEKKKPSYEQLEKELKVIKEKANSIVKDLRLESKELRGKWEKAEAELAQEQLDFLALKKSRGNANARELTSQLTKNLNEKHDKKIAELKAKHQKAIEEMKGKVEDAEDEAKEAKADFVQKEKDLKKEHAELKKDLRTEQQEAIKQAKADESKELREKKDLVKMMKNKLNAHEKDTTKSGEEIGGLQHEIDKLTRFKKQAVERMRDLHVVIDKVKDFSSSIGQEYAAKTAVLEQKLVHEGKRWEKMRECCEELRRQLKEQTRSNFVFRNANEGKVRRLEEVMREMERLRGMVRAGEDGGMVGGKGEGAGVRDGESGDGESATKSKGEEGGKAVDLVDSYVASAGEVRHDAAAGDKKTTQQTSADTTATGADDVNDASPLDITAHTPTVEDFLTPEDRTPATNAGTAKHDRSPTSHTAASETRIDSPTERSTTPKSAAGNGELDSSAIIEPWGLENLGSSDRTGEDFGFV